LSNSRRADEAFAIRVPFDLPQDAQRLLPRRRIQITAQEPEAPRAVLVDQGAKLAFEGLVPGWVT
jgi:hypothetical protein